MTKALFPMPNPLVGAARDAQQLFDAQEFHETITRCEQELAALDKQLAPRNNARPQNAAPDSAAFQYYALTLILVNALAALQEWKAAKEALGKYRVRFPRDPWGFRAGAQVTRRDRQVKDKAAVQRAIELLEGEAERLENLTR
jgi:hypothetical protein